MATTPTTSQGVELQRGNDVGGASNSWTLIAGILSISGPNITSAQIDVTSLDDTAKKYIAGLDDGGEVSIEGNFLGSNAQQTGLRTDQQSRYQRDFRLVFNDAVSSTPGRFDFTAIVTSFGFSAGVDNQVKFTATLKITGDLTFTAPT